MISLELSLRNLQRDLATTTLENDQLKSLLQGEQELRDDRTTEETHAALLVHEDLKAACGQTEEDKRRAKRQREVAEVAVGGLDKCV